MHNLNIQNQLKTEQEQEHALNGFRLGLHYLFFHHFGNPSKEVMDAIDTDTYRPLRTTQDIFLSLDRQFKSEWTLARHDFNSFSDEEKEQHCIVYFDPMELITGVSIAQYNSFLEPQNHNSFQKVKCERLIKITYNGIPELIGWILQETGCTKKELMELNESIKPDKLIKCLVNPFRCDPTWMQSQTLYAWFHGISENPDECLHLKLYREVRHRLNTEMDSRLSEMVIDRESIDCLVHDLIANRMQRHIKSWSHILRHQ